MLIENNLGKGTEIHASMYFTEASGCLEIIMISICRMLN